FQGDQTLVFEEFDLAEANSLEVRSVPSPRPQTHFLELRPHIIGGQLIAARSGAAAFQQVVGQKGHMRPQALGSYALQKFVRRKIRRSGLPKREGNHQHKTEQHNETPWRQTCLPCNSRVRRYRSRRAMALIRPGIVYSAASMSTGKPTARRVDEVIGPMEANRTRSVSLPIWTRATRPRLSASSATKFLTVEELVKV